MLLSKKTTLADKSFFHFFDHNQNDPRNRFAELPITMNIHDYKRADVFLDDLYEVTDNEVNLKVEDLVNLLYGDFLSTVRQGVEKLPIIAYLLDLRQAVQSRFLENRDDHGIYVISANPITAHLSSKRVKSHALPCMFKERNVKRGEVFLMDLNEVDPTFDMKVEELISLLFFDFVQKIVSGNQADLLHSINSIKNNMS